MRQVMIFTPDDRGGSTQGWSPHFHVPSPFRTRWDKRTWPGNRYEFRHRRIVHNWQVLDAYWFKWIRNIMMNPHFRILGNLPYTTTVNGDDKLRATPLPPSASRPAVRYLTCHVAGRTSVRTILLSGSRRLAENPNPAAKTNGSLV